MVCKSQSRVLNQGIFASSGLLNPLASASHSTARKNKQQQPLYAALKLCSFASQTHSSIHLRRILRFSLSISATHTSLRSQSPLISFSRDVGRFLSSKFSLSFHFAITLSSLSYYLKHFPQILLFVPIVLCFLWHIIQLFVILIALLFVDRCLLLGLLNVIAEFVCVQGTSADQDTRFSNKQLKLLKSQKFAPELEHLVRFIHWIFFPGFLG